MKKFSLFGALAAVAVLGVTSCGSSGSTVKVGLHANLGAGAGYSAINQGFMKDEGITAEAVVGDGPSLATQVIANQIQVSFMGGGVAWNYFTENSDIKIVALDNLTDDDSIFSNGTTLISFLYYIADTGKYDFERTNTYSISYENIDFSYNALNKYDERDNEFEDNPNCTYLYFKNEDFSNFTLQVVINNGVESADNDILNFYSENCGYIQYIDYTKMDDFYNYQKEFYLIDFHGNTRVKLDCNNLFYEALNGIDNDAERIILLSNGYIPFYDEDENGYFNLMGQKVTVAPNYLLYDVVDDNIVLIDKQTNHTIIVSSESNNIIKDEVFDWDIMLNFQGETGPYIQYMYVRTKSILDKENYIMHKEDVDIKELEEHGLELVKQIYMFNSVIEQAVEKNEPSIISRYLIEIAKLYSSFYNDNKIIVEDEKIKKSRLCLTYMVGNVLKIGAGLLGMEMPDRM